MTSQTTTIAVSDGEFSAYLASPAKTPAPGIVVIQEIFGVNSVMRGICDRLSGAGFVALCPDLFWRLEPGVELSDKSEQDMAKAFDFFGRFDVDRGVSDIAASIGSLRARPETTQKIGAVGYCLGGLLAYLTACRTDADAAAGYYGVSINEHLDEAGKISAPLLLHIAGADEFVSKEAQSQIHAALDGHPQVTIYDYPGLGHAFAREGGDHYDKEAAALADARSIDFFRAHLR